MDAEELLRNWPSWAKANAARVLASPAWRVKTHFDGEDAVLAHAAGDAAATPLPIVLDVRLGDVSRSVSFAPAPCFPDLWLLKDRLAALPPEVLLALVEKECGAFFVFLEETFKRPVSVMGLAPAADDAAARFALAMATALLPFALALTPELELQLGGIENLDAAHPAIRGLVREAHAHYAALPLSAAEADALAVGDFLVPEAPFAPAWLFDLPADDALHVVAPERAALTFAQLADDALPPVPDAAAFQLFRAGALFGTAERAAVGCARALRLTSLSGK